MSLTQHHDSITGTEKQHVANDYHERLSAGLAVGGVGVVKWLREPVASCEHLDCQPVHPCMGSACILGVS